jgi:hypothetical protein
MDDSIATEGPAAAGELAKVDVAPNRDFRIVPRRNVPFGARTTAQPDNGKASLGIPLGQPSAW